jgi:YVTN family beta-propeller protein
MKRTDGCWLPSRAVVAAALAFTSAACSSSTGPGVVSGTHPAGELAPRVDGVFGRPFGIRVSSKGLVLVTQQSTNSVQGFALDLAGPLLPPVPVGDDPGDVVFNRAGTTAYVSAFFGGSVQIIDIATMKQTSSVAISNNAYRLALSSDETRLFITSMDGRLYSMPTSGSSLITSVAIGGQLQGLTMSPSGQTLVVSSTSGIVARVNASTMTVINKRTISGTPQDVVLSPDERELYVAKENGAVDVLDGSTLADIESINLPNLGAFGMALTPDGSDLYVTSSSNGVVAVIDRKSRAIRKLLTVTGTPRRVAFSPDGKTAVIANEGGWVDVVK